MELKEAFKQLVESFNDDYERAFEWLTTYQSGLSTTPMHLIRIGKSKIVSEYIKKTISVEK